MIDTNVMHSKYCQWPNRHFKNCTQSNIIQVRLHQHCFIPDKLKDFHHYMQNMDFVHYLFIVNSARVRFDQPQTFTFHCNTPMCQYNSEFTANFWCDSQVFPQTRVKCVSYVKNNIKKLYKYIISAALKVQTS